MNYPLFNNKVAARIAWSIAAFVVFYVVQAGWMSFAQTLDDTVVVACAINTVIMALGLLGLRQGEISWRELALLILYQGVYWLPEWGTYTIMIFTLVWTLRVEDFCATHRVQDEYECLFLANMFILTGYLSGLWIIGMYDLPMTAIQGACIAVLTLYSAMHLFSK
jgi:predicted signal transduction protein with EAL and GGDEF domain